MPSETRNFTTFANEQVTPEDRAWSGPGLAQASDNDRALGQGGIPTTTYSQRLKSTNAGYSIGSDATITGIRIRVERSCYAYPNDLVYDYRIQLYKAGSLVGSNKAVTGTQWTTTDTYISYGGDGDLWGTTWTSAEINASGFGNAVSVRQVPVYVGGFWEPGVALVDHVEVTVWWTAPADGFHFASQIISAIFVLAAPLMHRMGFWQQTRGVLVRS